MKNNSFYRFFTAEYWNETFRGRRTLRSRFGKFMRICIASLRGFTDDDCADKASALTFYTLLSIIPILAVAFAIAKGFGFEQHLESEILLHFGDQREIADKLISFSHSMLKNAQGGLIAGVGLAFLLWSVVKLMSNIESSFNAIWKINKPRSWPRRISDYVTMMLFCPLFFAISSSLTLYVSTQLQHFSETNDTLKIVTPYFFLLFHLFPLVLSWFLLTALYYVMPNTKVPFIYALVAGIAAGTVYQLVQWIYLQFQFGLTSYGAIYGSFAALPLFLLWLNASWLIALAGAEVAYHAENDMTASGDYPFPQQRHTDARVLALLIMQHSVAAFKSGVRPPTIYNIAKETGIGVVTARQLVHELLQYGLLVEITWRDGTSGYYQPGRDLSKITVKDVCDALDRARHEDYAIHQTPQAEIYEKTLAKFDELLKDAQINYALDRMPRG